MTGTVRLTAAVVALTIAAAGAGFWGGARIGAGRTHHSSSLDEILHKQLALTVEQERRIADLETQFSGQQRELEKQMRSANRELAQALQSEHSYGEKAKAAVAHFHDAMAKLQELTILHVLDMRAALTPAQAARFDETIRDSLTSDLP